MRMPLDEINNREQEDPHYVHKVPIQSSNFHAPVVFLAVSTLEGSHSDVHVPDDASEDVQPVKAREREEDGAKQAGAGGRALIDKRDPLIRLNTQENDAEHDCGNEKTTQALLIAVLNGCIGAHHRQTTDEQDDMYSPPREGTFNS